MISIDEFLAILRDQVGVDASGDDLDRALHELDGWDSVHLLSLLTIVERASGRPLSLPAALEATTLHELYAVAAR